MTKHTTITYTEEYQQCATQLIVDRNHKARETNQPQHQSKKQMNNVPRQLKNEHRTDIYLTVPYNRTRRKSTN